ncbi:hypothetical protein AGOR_G00140250 [Albula goreensis]|uniref:Alpha-1,3-mannosyl-glycoprotein 4-beta-N-acetylglucosaminyltransferase C n=1 Tax=Albula goreensis TaxID=1534307 RepID=A0A8T3D9X6_9TELE|nr:hypothetical protein AGOR_G00140250 [Albula goreensis]
MRIYWKKTFTATTLIFAVTVFYVAISHYSSHQKIELSGPQLLARAIASQHATSARALQVFQDLQNDSVPFNVSYSLLAGSLAQTQKYLAVGLSSIKRKRGSYLLDTLKSIFSQSSEEELKEMVVVVFLADFNMEWNEQTLSEISTRFTVPILKGQLLVIHAPQKYYPPLEGLKRNFNDSPDRVRFRSKQNVDYAFLFRFSADLSQYFIMIEDDVICAKNFFTAIKTFIQAQAQSYWVTLEFSKLGYIGKLYHSNNLPQLAKFLFLFYQEMPCDWLLNHFNMLLTQKDTIRFKPSLFQHAGLYSSFGGTINRLKDNDFDENPGNVANNPPAAVLTDMVTFERHTPEKAYSNVDGYFWGKSPAMGNHFTVVLHEPAVFRRVMIVTGSKDGKKDLLGAAEVEVGQNPVKMTEGPQCSKYFKLGPLVKGQFDRKNIQEGISSSLSCLKITVTEKQEDWVIIQKISIWTENKNQEVKP